MTLDQGAVIDLGTMANDVRGYYEGERISTYIVSGLGVAAMGLGVPLVLQDSDFARGVGWPLLILGALQTDMRSGSIACRQRP